MPNIENAEELVVNINNAESEDTAKINGNYDDLTAGTAKQLLSSNYVEDREPYSFRTAGGSANIGNRLTEKIIGGSLVWNQIQASTASRTHNGITYTYSNGKLTVQGTATANSLWVGAQQAVQWNWRANHVYLIDVGNDAYSGTSSKQWRIPKTSGGSTTIQINSHIQFIKETADFGGYLTFAISNGQTVDPEEEYYPQVFDLTQMFGSAVADYVYSLEQATSGAGVAWFRNLFAKLYYAFNAGEIMSVKVAEHKTVKADSTEHLYPLDTSLELRGIPKLDSSNKLYYDGDVYESDGMVTRKYGVIDMGSLNWNYGAVQGINYFYVNIAGQRNGKYRGQCVSPLYNCITTNPYSSAEDKTLFIGNSAAAPVLYVRDDDYSDKNVYKAAVNGVYLVYELAEPTTETAEPFQTVQIVDASGTEEYIDYGVEQAERDVSIPVGHETKYYKDLRGKLEELSDIPSAPSVDGTYSLVCTVSNGEATYAWVANT